MLLGVIEIAVPAHTRAGPLDPAVCRTLDVAFDDDKWTELTYGSLHASHSISIIDLYLIPPPRRWNVYHVWHLMADFRATAGLAAGLKRERQAGRHQRHFARDGGDALIQPTLLVAEAARQRVLGHDAPADFVADEDDAAR